MNWLTQNLLLFFEFWKVQPKKLKMTIKKNLVLVFVLVFQINFAQDIFIKGLVLNFEGGKSIPYVNIGIMNKSIGTISNSKGKFKLRLNEKLIDLNDSITFSCIGFKSKNFKVSSLLNKENRIKLIEETTVLEEVLVSTKQPKAKKLGRSIKGLGLMHWNFYSYYDVDVDDRLSKELGMKFNLRKDCEITDLNFNITSNQFNSIKFRINFYSVDNNKPIERLFNKDIIFEVKDGFLGWYKVDLKKYNLYIDKEVEDVAITIQWLESEKIKKDSKYFGISVSASPTNKIFFREKVMDKWTVKKGRLSFFVNALYY